ncbi:MAG: WecB/TagA/CpsF family glycosyltransferase [Candidatus Omnitrophica bacterium]|nr:WecB/TagA/CpsF family glycosyltransferase [Candidatus Omnitrophota bacterium]
MEDCIAKNIHHNYIIVANVDTIMQSKHNPKIQEAVNASSLSIPDGFPLLIMQRLHGNPLKKRAYGPDLMNGFLKITGEKKYSHFFYGATEDTLDNLTKKLKVLFPGIRIAGAYSPPFRPLTLDEDAKIVEMINKAAPSVLWVGIGCPKQELWMYEHREQLSVPVMLGVGAAFDFLAGVKPQAPRWIRDNGFEWFFRLITEPKRLWRRYLMNYPLFVYHVLVELVSKPIKSLLNK